jgi:hypothetical protein
MFQDASYAAHASADTRLARADLPIRPLPGPVPSWRHAATAGLLLVTLPVFAVAAVACLPVLLAVATGQSLRRLWALAFVDAQEAPQIRR